MSKVSIFNLNNDNIHKESVKTSGSGDYFKPSAKNGKDGVYTAAIRFVPFVKDPENSLVDNWRVWLTDPLTDQSQYVILPPRPEKNIITDAFFKLYKSDSVAEQNMSKSFSGSKSFSALVQIVKDEVNPDNVGKILIWNFGVKVQAKLAALMDPSAEDDLGLGASTEKSFPFDPFSAKLFYVKVKSVGGFNNYDDCKFIEKLTPIMMDGKFATPDEQQTDEYRIKLQTYLETNSPDLSKQMYHPWDAKTTEHVHSSIRNIIQDTDTVKALLGSSNIVSTVIVSDPLNVQNEDNPPLSPTFESVKEESLEFEDNLDLDDEMFEGL